MWSCTATHGASRHVRRGTPSTRHPTVRSDASDAPGLLAGTASHTCAMALASREWQETELCRDPGGRFLYVMGGQNSIQTGVILAKRNPMETIPCHLTALAQTFKQTSRSRERLQTRVSPRRTANVVTRTLRHGATESPLRLASSTRQGPVCIMETVDRRLGMARGARQGKKGTKISRCRWPA